MLCVICVFCRLVVLARLSVPVQVTDCRLVSEMTYNVLMGTLNPTHSLTRSLTHSLAQFIRMRTCSGVVYFLSKRGRSRSVRWRRGDRTADEVRRGVDVAAGRWWSRSAGVFVVDVSHPATNVVAATPTAVPGRSAARPPRQQAFSTVLRHRRHRRHRHRPARHAAVVQSQ